MDVILQKGRSEFDYFYAEKTSFLDDITNQCKAVAFRAASYLTDPICKSRECYYMAAVVDQLYPDQEGLEKIINVVRKWGYLAGYVLYGAVAVVTTLPGIALRSLAANFSNEPFLYAKGKGLEKTLCDSFSLLSWNICFVPGGYSITDGGMVSYFYRLEKIATKILEQDADIVCLYETFDTGSAMDLAEKLKEKYAHVYYNIAPRSIGTSSGIFIASKFAITDFNVDLFPADTLVGTTKYSAKAVVGFKAANHVQVFTTHAQHGEEPEFPTEEEVLANKRQMEIVLGKIKKIKEQNTPVVLCGDLNLPRGNLESVPGLTLVSNFSQGKDTSSLIFLDGNKENKISTWGGDESCVRFYGKKISGPLELDYVLAANVKSLVTDVLKTGYNPKIVTFSADSDHNPLLSVIAL